MTTKNKKSPRPQSAKGGSPSRYVMECQVGFLMRVAMQRHTSIFMSLIPHNLTQTQFAVVAKLAEVGTTSQNHLGRLVCLDAATTKGVVDRLRMRGIVTIEINPRDRRHSMVALTKAGAKIAKQSIDRAHQITMKTLAPLKRNERRAIVQLLQKMA
jgi:MarR family transcriptional regulator, lower aerobic nicotinate degradation pathway regulator